MPAVEVGQLAGADALERRAPAEHRPAVRMSAVERLHDRQLEGVPGIVVQRRQLFENDGPLGLDLPRLEAQSAHPVGLDPQRFLPAVGGEAELVEGGVVAGVGVVVAAELPGAAVDLAGTVAGRALEHHVLEEVGDAQHRGLFGCGARPVADHGRDDGRLAALDQPDQQPALQPPHSRWPPAFGGAHALCSSAPPATGGGGGASPSSV